MTTSALRRCAVSAAAVALVGTGMPAASAKTFVTPPPASKFAASFKVATAGYFAANATLDAGGTAHLAWQSPGAASLTSCTLPRGARRCSAMVTLPLAHGDDNAYGRTMVLLPSPGVVEVVANECCQPEPQLPISVWISRDGGATFAAPVSVGSLSGLDFALADQGQLVLFSQSPGGLHEQVTPADGSVPATTDTVISPDGGVIKAVTLPGGAILIAHETTLFSPTQKDSTHVDLQASPGAAPGQVASFPGEDLLALATGEGATYVMTRDISTTGVLDPPVRVRRWNGSGFDPAHVLPVPGTGDDSRFSLAVDGSGRLHAVWVGAREDYRLWHSVSANGGRSWRATLLGDASRAAEVYPVLDARGIGIALELTAGTGPAVIQPLLLTPAVRLTVNASKTGFAAHVAPTVPGLVVSLQRLNGKRWVTVASARESRTGAVSFPAVPLRSGRTSYRASVAGKWGTYDVGSSALVSVRGPA